MPDDAELQTITDLLRQASLEQVPVDAQLTLSLLDTKLEEGRLALLTALKAAGVERLTDRQALANTLGKAKRLGTLKPNDQAAEKASPSPILQTLGTPASMAAPSAPVEPAKPPAAAASTGVLRWIVDISQWAPTSVEWEMLLGLIPEEDSAKTMRFVRLDDRKRALASRLLQRRASAEVTGLAYAAVSIKRTKGSKPYLENRPLGTSSLPNWNFNVSHEGNYVALAAEPRVLCGVDVAAPTQDCTNPPQPQPRPRPNTPIPQYPNTPIPQYPNTPATGRASTSPRWRTLSRRLVPIAWPSPFPCWKLFGWRALRALPSSAPGGLRRSEAVRDQAGG